MWLNATTAGSKTVGIHRKMKKEIELDISEFVGLKLGKVQSTRLTFNKAVLDLWCPWRIHDDLIFMNSKVLDDKNTSKEAEQIVQKNLIGRTIKTIQIFEKPCDIRIELDNESIIEVFPDHPIYESWNLKFEGIDGRHLVGAPGGEVTWFLKNGEE